MKFMRIFNKKFFNSCLRFVKRDIFKRYNLRFPDSIQIQTISVCNGKCIFCPYPEVNDKFTHGKMERSLFESVVKELASNKISVIYPYLMNEPFLDKEIFDKIRYMKDKIPSASIVLTTNGTLLTDDSIKKLLESRLDNLVISLNTVDAEIYSRMMGMGFDLVRGGIEKLMRKTAACSSKLKILISIVITKENEGSLDKIYDFCKTNNLRYFTNRVENRAGNLGNYSDIKLAQRPDDKRLQRCVRPLVQAYLLYNGDMLLCCADWRRRVVLGNVLKDGGIMRVWNSDRARKLRDAVRRGQFDKISICVPCTFKHECNI